jgi:predicted nucleic acid-binding protein
VPFGVRELKEQASAIVDASVWISALLPQDVHHSVSRTWRRARIADGGTFTLPWLILPEVAGAVARRTGQALLGDQAVATILAAQHAASFPLKGVDTALAERLGLSLVTWDNEQVTRTGDRIRVLRPAI